MKLLWLGLVVILFGCSLIEKSEEIEFEDLVESRYFWFNEAGTKVITADSTYQGLWENNWTKYIDAVPTKAELPPIDFNSKTLIIIHYGWFSEGAMRQIDVVEKVEKTADEITVTLKKMPDLPSWQAISSPLQLITIDRLDLPVEFEGHLP